MDVTETTRREQVKKLNTDPGSREALSEKYGDVWNTSEVQKDFSILSFLAPYVVVQRKSDGIRGTLMFQHSPRFYFEFKPH